MGVSNKLTNFMKNWLESNNKVLLLHNNMLFDNNKKAWPELKLIPI